MEATVRSEESRETFSELGPLIHLTGERGPFVSGLAKEVTVADALINGEWWLTASRSRNAIISLLKQCLPSPVPIAQSRDDDKYLWKMGEAPPSSSFSKAKTWLTIHQPNPPVFWHEQI
ncbi:PREDICTED: uncharacterized protein LOC106341135 [Brassica oleracea var. oleracea]|uniref:uncharacterized protein LOC106341135 n=1 Tax=Brassica oleracea var. oleracea TaxID=109376 RepID=UPI0006A75191|nr:PREDICTED: uncharacterized protein LOC106341135 [Brassica oleracea var. oleracea]